MVKRRKAVRRKTARKGKSTKKGSKTATRHNRAAHWKAYHELQTKADKAWEKFRADVRKNARSDILIRDQNHLRLLLAECNYMARECMRMASKGKMQIKSKMARGKTRKKARSRR